MADHLQSVEQAADQSEIVTPTKQEVEQAVRERAA